jgi:3-deoxy-D-manno-octulosonic-acid transferase
LRHIYSLILFILLPLVLLRLLILGFRVPAYRTQWKERLGFSSVIESDKSLIWLHAVSVGEVEAAVPLINGLRNSLTEYKFLVTTVTPTGAETVRRRFGDSVQHLYLPYDLPFSVNHFLEKIKPSICIIMETEIWPNLYHQCKAKSIPIALVNARLSLKSFKGYQYFSGLVKNTLACVAKVIAQTELDAERFISMGCESAKMSVIANLKYDSDLTDEMREQAKLIRTELFSGRLVWIAASTHDGEEKIILEVHKEILKQHENCLLILVPRHPQRFDKVEKLSLEAGLSVVRNSKSDEMNSLTRVYLLDSLGELKTYYGCADVAFVGGSMVSAGGHNLLEPAQWGLAIISGTDLSNFHEISELLVSGEALVMVSTQTELVNQVNELISNKVLREKMGCNARALLKMHEGSALKIIKEIKSMIG